MKKRLVWFGFMAYQSAQRSGKKHDSFVDVDVWGLEISLKDINCLIANAGDLFIVV